MPYSTFTTLRTARNTRLQESDFCMLADHKSTLPEEQRLGEVTAIGVYRQNLRDLPSTVKVDENGDAILNSDGKLQNTADAVIELPAKPH
tara:strand:+ start:158 stop:427 length:270 start_codon:yes stop_codon:yes gene_type:complete